MDNRKTKVINDKKTKVIDENRKTVVIKDNDRSTIALNGENNIYSEENLIGLEIEGFVFNKIISNNSGQSIVYLITKNNKKGIIDETGKIISDFQYDEISTIDNYIITYLDGNIYVYDNTMKLLDMEKTNTNNIDDLVLLSNEEKITIIITTQNSSISNIYKYNKTENKFIK